MAHFEAIKLMLERKIPFPRDLFWIFPHDEEINGWAAQASVKVFREKFGIGTKGFDFIIDEGTPPVRGVIPFNKEHFMMIGYSAKGGVNVELKVDFDKAGHGSIPARESAITILTKGIFQPTLSYYMDHRHSPVLGYRIFVT